MRNSLFHSTLLSLTLIASCSSSRTPVKNDVKLAKSELEELTLSAADDVFVKEPKAAENTHALVDAQASDVSIKQTVGVANIDEVLPEAQQEIPYARDFLAQKNTVRMKFWVDYFTNKQRERFQRFINNGEEYRSHIEKILVQHDLPKELYFVGLIESGYYLGARSHASAVGPWQFVKGTGVRYGLKVNHELDERQDLFKATRAAALYFKDLHNIFSSWELALSAYNAGEYGIIRRILKFGTRDFYALSHNKQLPSETINYVPKVLAAMHVMNNAEKYGFVIPKKAKRLYDVTELRAVKKNVPLSRVAQQLKMDVSVLKKLNPELKRNFTPRHFAGTYYLRVPKSGVMTSDLMDKPETPKELNRRIAEVPSTKTNPEIERLAALFKRPRTHRVKKGESIFSIAKKYNMSPLDIARMNDMKSWRRNVKAGSVLALREVREVQQVSMKLAAPKVQMTKKPLIYKIRKGDSLTNLAKLFNLKVSEIKSVNRLKKSKVQVGQRITFPDTKKAFYTVKQGDHLYKVARDLNRPVEALVKLNSLNRKKIYPGQKLIVNMD